MCNLCAIQQAERTLPIWRGMLMLQMSNIRHTLQLTSTNNIPTVWAYLYAWHTCIRRIVEPIVVASKHCIYPWWIYKTRRNPSLLACSSTNSLVRIGSLTHTHTGLPIMNHQQLPSEIKDHQLPSIAISEQPSKCYTWPTSIQKQQLALTGSRDRPSPEQVISSWGSGCSPLEASNIATIHPGTHAS